MSKYYIILDDSAKGHAETIAVLRQSNNEAAGARDYSSKSTRGLTAHLLGTHGEVAFCVMAGIDYEKVVTAKARPIPGPDAKKQGVTYQIKTARARGYNALLPTGYGSQDGRVKSDYLVLMWPDVDLKAVEYMGALHRGQVELLKQWREDMPRPCWLVPWEAFKRAGEK